MSKKANYNQVLDVLLKIWVVCFGSITAVAVAGWFVPYQWLPILSFSLILVVIWCGNHFMSTGHINCSLLTHYTIYTLFTATVIMLAINYAYEKDIILPWLRMAGDKSMNTVDMPYITSCIIYPVATLFFAIAAFRRSRTNYCAHCHERSSFSLREAIEHGQFIAEAKRIIYLYLILSALLATIDVSYFLAYYDDTNINTSDTYFLFIFPAIFYLLSIIYLTTRFQNLKFEINFKANAQTDDSFSQLRFMVVRDDKIMLRQAFEGEDAPELWDTPATHEMPLTENVSDDEARKIFTSLAGTEAFKIRHLFNTSTTSSNSFHFAAFIDDDIEATMLEGEWFNLYQIDTMLKTGKIARPFAYEIHRVYTMTMAWKSYDRNGKRLYPIKNYKPTFRISDFKDWDLDYTDMHWMMVAENNADRPFFKMRQFWRRYISGADKKWKRND